MTAAPQDEPNLPAQQSIDRICDAFEQAWQSGTQPDVRDFVNLAGLADREALVYELILLDYDYRQKTSGDLLGELQYADLLPEFSASVTKAFATLTGRGDAGEQETLVGTQPPVASSGRPASFKERVRYFGDYELIEELARGGMGVVYRAKQISLNRVIALKMILAGSIAGDEEIRRFQREAEAAANLDHPGIVPIYDIGEHKGQHYFSMKLIEGPTLSQMGETLKGDPSRVIALVSKVADAIHHAHQRGILHRDLKPANILLDATGQPMVTDFGLARNTKSDQHLTQTGAIVGTPGFMPPEQAAGKGVTTAADIYSLGAILYHLLCGRPPHQAESVMGTLLSVINDPPKKPRELNPDIDPDLELICMKCLAKEPAERYASAGEFAADLRAFSDGKPLHVRAPSLIELVRMWLSQNFGNVLWVPVIALVVGAIAGFTLWTSTIGQDMAFYAQNYAKFPPADRSWLAVNWRPAQVPMLVLFMSTLTAIGWATSRLVRTKNRSADIGAGLAVGLLSGLIAFSCGMGSVLVESQMTSVKQDQELLFQIAATDNKAESYAQQRLATRYPTLEPMEPVQRTVALSMKISGDRFAGSLKGIVVGTLVCLAWFGTLGVVEAWVAGPLIREQGRWRSLTSYLCFTFALVQLLFVVGSEVTTWVLMGSGYILDWPIPIALTTVTLLGLASVLYRWPLPAQLTVAAGWIALSVLFMNQAFLDGPPNVAGSRTEIKVAQRQFASDPTRLQNQMRLARARLEYGIVLSQLQKDKLALEQYRESLRAIETTPVPELQYEQTVLHAHVLSLAAAAAARLGDTEQAATWLALHTQQYASTQEQLAMYAKTVFDSQKPVTDFLAPTTATDLNAWYRLAVQLRALATHKEQGEQGDAQSTDAWMQQMVEQVFERTTETEKDAEWESHRQRLRQWLNSRQTWELFGPYAMENNQNPVTALDAVYGPEDMLVAGEMVAPDSTISRYMGANIDLIGQFGEKENSVIYARTQFKIDKPQRIRFRLGSDDGIKAWIDGNLLLRNAVQRGVFEGNDIVDLNEALPAGTHTLLLKISQGSGGWGFVTNLANVDNWPLQLDGDAPSSDQP